MHLNHSVDMLLSFRTNSEQCCLHSTTFGAHGEQRIAGSFVVRPRTVRTGSYSRRRDALASISSTPKFCEERGLTLSHQGHTVVWEHNIYQVFMFATDEHAEIFRAAFDGERMHPSEKGKGKHWSTWRKGTYSAKRT